MKVLFLTNEYPPNIYGGAGVHVDYLSRELSRLIEVEVRCFGDQNIQVPPLMVKGFNLPDAMLAGTPDKLKSPLGALIRNIQFNALEINADLVHCHTWYSHFGGILAKLLYGLPLVITTHSLEPLRPWKEEQLGRGYHFSSWIEKTALEMADAVIAVSEETKKDILHYFNISPEKIHIIPNGIDPAEYHPVNEKDALKRYGIPDNLNYVLFVGRITRQKGIIHLVNAVKYLNPHIGVIFCAGAPDTEDIAQEMKAGIEVLKKQRSNVYWIEKMLTKEETIQFYSHAGVFCCPSIYEPFGIINLEAMACNTPVVGSDTGGLKEIIVHGDTGLLIPFEKKPNAYDVKNPETFAKDLAQGINTIMNDNKLRNKMAKAGRQRAEQVYAWPIIARKVYELYNKLF